MKQTARFYGVLYRDFRFGFNTELFMFLCRGITNTVFGPFFTKLFCYPIINIFAENTCVNNYNKWIRF